MATIPNLPTLVRDKFKTAQESGDLTFYETRVSILQCNGLPFQVRFSPALANKPKSNKPQDPNQKPFNPFADPSDSLLITDIGSHNLVLNKFPVIPNHFILATKDYKEQTRLLEENDLAAAYSCLQSYCSHGERLFGFFNSGPYSGASQPHRHIQFLPVDSMRSGMSAEQDWDVLADSLVSNPELPFTYFSSAIPRDPTSKQLYEAYSSLYLKACQEGPGLTMGTVDNLISMNKESPISYNLGLTDRAMVLCQRTSEGIEIENINGELVGLVSLNGTVLGGTLLVKSEAEWNALRNDEAKLANVLGAIGINLTEHAWKKRL